MAWAGMLTILSLDQCTRSLMPWHLDVARKFVREKHSADVVPMSAPVYTAFVLCTTCVVYCLLARVPAPCRPTGGWVGRLTRTVRFSESWMKLPREKKGVNLMQHQLLWWWRSTCGSTRTHAVCPLGAYSDAHSCFALQGGRAREVRSGTQYAAPFANRGPLPDSCCKTPINR